MKKFKITILCIYIFLFANLFINKNFLISVIIFLGPNLYFSIFSKLSQKAINKIFIVEFIIWIFNCYFIVFSNSEDWFLALNNLLWLLTSIKMIEVRNNLNNKNIILLLFLCIGTSSIFNIGFISNLIHIFSLILLINSLLVLDKYKSEKHYQKCLTMLANYNHEKI